MHLCKSGDLALTRMKNKYRIDNDLRLKLSTIQKHTLCELLYLIMITSKNAIVPKYPHDYKRDIIIQQVKNKT